MIRTFSIGKAIAAAALVALAGCGDSDQATGTPAGSGVNRELAEQGIDFDASTMDAMSVDVVAGAVPPAADPESADAGIDMVGSDEEETATAAAGDAATAADSQ